MEISEGIITILDLQNSSLDHTQPHPITTFPDSRGLFSVAAEKRKRK